MRNSFAAYYGLLILCSALPRLDSSAQEATPVPPPTFPIKLRAPDKATWTITVKGGREGGENPGTDPKPSAGLKQLTITKTAPIYFEKATLDNGKTWQKWIFVTPAGTYRLVQNPGSPGWERLWDSRYEDVSRYEQSDFEDFEWINKKNYAGVETIDGKPMYAFKETSSGPITRRDEGSYDPGGAASGSVKQTFTAQAWLDAGTLLPVKFDDGRETRTYAFGEAPAAQLAPPSDVLAALKKWVEDIKQMNR